MLYLRTMQMNRYLLAALYVMAGCAVTVPLKAQECGGLFKADRCRPVIATTLKVVAACTEDSKAEHHWATGLSCDYALRAREREDEKMAFPTDAACSKAGPLCHITHKIRAPGMREMQA